MYLPETTFWSLSFLQGPEFRSLETQDSFAEVHSLYLTDEISKKYKISQHLICLFVCLSVWFLAPVRKQNIITLFCHPCLMFLKIFRFGEVTPAPHPILLFALFCKRKKNLRGWILVKGEEQSSYSQISFQTIKRFHKKAWPFSLRFYVLYWKSLLNRVKYHTYE